MSRPGLAPAGRGGESGGVEIDILMPPPGGSYAAMVKAPFEQYRTLLAKGGFRAVPRPWTDGPGARPALALLAWGYHLDVAAWDRLLDAWPAATPLVNPPGLLRWNTRKTYLAALEAAGVPVVPTLFGDAARAATAFDRFETDELVVKPQISAGSDATTRLRRGDPPPQLPAAMIQPFLPSIGTEGELSLFFFGGVLSHAIRKVAAAGDFRVQPQFGGAISACRPDAEALAVAEAARKAAPPGAVYARVDLVRRTDGRLALIELEAIEPDLYLDYGAQGGLLLEALAAEFRRRG